MAVPFRKVSKTRKRMRRTHYKVEENGLIIWKQVKRYDGNTIYWLGGDLSVRRFEIFCSRNITGLSSRMAVRRRPAASRPVEGQATFRPGKCMKMVSRLWEWVAALPRPMPCWPPQPPP